MSVLQRQIEAQGVSTVSITLYKEFTRKVQAPRALWVPFPFGRPLGAPNNKSIQRKVILAALELLSRSRGPVLEDFLLTPEEEHLDARNQTVGAKCGVKGCNFEDALSTPDEQTVREKAAALAVYDGNLELVRNEIEELRLPQRSYMDRYQGRTQIGHSGVTADSIFKAAEYLHRFVNGEAIEIPQYEILSQRDGMSLQFFIRLCADDLKTYYQESRLGAGALDEADTGDFNEWFWFRTRAASLIVAARDRVLESTDRKKDPYCVVARGMVPRGYGEERRMNPETVASTIIVYHGDGCSACHAEMEFLSKNQIAFTAKNVTRDKDARQQLMSLGSKTVPTTVFNGEVIVGFEVDRLKQLLHL